MEIFWHHSHSWITMITVNNKFIEKATTWWSWSINYVSLYWQKYFCASMPNIDVMGDLDFSNTVFEQKVNKWLYNYFFTSQAGYLCVLVFNELLIDGKTSGKILVRKLSLHKYYCAGRVFRLTSSYITVFH